MSLTDVMSAMDLAVYPQVAMVLFMAVFVSVAWRVLSKPRREEHARAARLPLEEGSRVCERREASGLEATR